jgi:hypothetical protein
MSEVSTMRFSANVSAFLEALSGGSLFTKASHPAFTEGEDVPLLQPMSGRQTLNLFDMDKRGKVALNERRSSTHQRKRRN